MQHNHADRGTYHEDCSACRFLAELMNDAGFSLPNQAAHVFGPDRTKYPTITEARHYRNHLTHEHSLPLDLDLPQLKAVHAGCHRTREYAPSHYSEFAHLHTDVVRKVREQSRSVKRRAHSAHDAAHREARLRQTNEAGNREALLHAQKVTAVTQRVRRDLQAILDDNGKRAETFMTTLKRDIEMHPAEGLEIYYGFDRPYTYAIAQLVTPEGLKPYLGLGTACCSHTDTWDRSMGKHIAVARAITEIGQQMSQGAQLLDELRNARHGRV